MLFWGCLGVGFLTGSWAATSAGGEGGGVILVASSAASTVSAGRGSPFSRRRRADGRGALDSRSIRSIRQSACSSPHRSWVSVPASKARCIIILTLDEVVHSSMQRERVLSGHSRQLGIASCLTSLEYQEMEMCSCLFLQRLMTCLKTGEPASHIEGLSQSFTSGSVGDAFGKAESESGVAQEYYTTKRQVRRNGRAGRFC